MTKKKTEAVLDDLAARGIRPTMGSKDLMGLMRDDEGKTGDEVIDEIAGGMASAYDPEAEDEREENGRSKGGKTGGKRKAGPAMIVRKRSDAEFWRKREHDKLHDIVRAHVQDMLDLAGWTITTGKDSLEFRRELRELIEKRFAKGTK